MSSGTGSGPVPKQLVECVAKVEEIASQLDILAEALQDHMRTLNEFIRALEERTQDRIKLIQSITQTRSTLQIFAHTLETDPQQRWRPARLLLSISLPFPLHLLKNTRAHTVLTHRQEPRPSTRL